MSDYQLALRIQNYSTYGIVNPVLYVRLYRPAWIPDRPAPPQGIIEFSVFDGPDGSAFIYDRRIIYGPNSWMVSVPPLLTPIDGDVRPTDQEGISIDVWLNLPLLPGESIYAFVNETEITHFIQP